MHFRLKFPFISKTVRDTDPVNIKHPVARTSQHQQSFLLPARRSKRSIMLRRRGWLAGRVSHADIVSKRLNLSENFFDHLVAPSFKFLLTPTPMPNSKGTASAGVFYSNFIPKMHRFWDIRLVSIKWPWNPGWGSLKVIEDYTIQSGTYDFLLTFHSNHRPISHRFWDKRWYPSKITRKSLILPPPCI